MFGDGVGYQTAVLVGDLVAVLTVPAIIALSSASNTSGTALLAALPTTLTGPIIHWAHGRAIPGVISLFGWASIPPSAVTVGVVVVLGNIYNAAAGIAAFIGIATVGASVMTAVDWYMARDMTSHPPKKASTLQWVPSVVPVRGGAWAGVSAAW